MRELSEIVELDCPARPSCRMLALAPSRHVKHAEICITHHRIPASRVLLWSEDEGRPKAAGRTIA